MDKSEFKKIVQEITNKYGFIYCKKNYYCETDNLIAVIGLQKSNFDNILYINYGFYVKGIHNDLQYPKNNECDVTGRFLNETNKGVYQLGAFTAEELRIDLDNNIREKVIPAIEQGIDKYFELFPNSICRATLNLKKYLGLS